MNKRKIINVIIGVIVTDTAVFHLLAGAVQSSSAYNYPVDEFVESPQAGTL